MATKTAAEVMQTKVITIDHDTTLQRVAELLIENKISGAPVVDDHDKLVGVISESDLLNNEKRRDALPRTAVFGVTVVNEEALLRAFKDGQTLLAHQVMTRDVFFAKPYTPVTELANTMVQNKINRIPVVSETNEVIGIVTREDLLKALY